MNPYQLDVLELGRLLVTPHVLAHFAEPGHLEEIGLTLEYLRRHARGDWGEVDAEDTAANERALKEGSRVLSAYTLPCGQRLWLITEADRSATTILRPEDY